MVSINQRITMMEFILGLAIGFLLGYDYYRLRKNHYDIF
jgi:NhaP-type Na+/H+ or K+/H+ antiporter